MRRGAIPSEGYSPSSLTNEILPRRITSSLSFALTVVPMTPALSRIESTGKMRSSGELEASSAYIAWTTFPYSAQASAKALSSASP